MTFSAQMHRMAEKRLPFERLVVDASLALEIFQVRGKGIQVSSVYVCNICNYIIGLLVTRSKFQHTYVFA